MLFTDYTFKEFSVSGRKLKTEHNSINFNGTTGYMQIWHVKVMGRCCYLHHRRQHKGKIKEEKISQTAPSL